MDCLLHKRQTGGFLAVLQPSQVKIHALLPSQVRSAQRDVEFIRVSHWWIPFFIQKGRKSGPNDPKMLTNAVCIEFTPKRQRHWLPAFHFLGFTAFLSANTPLGSRNGVLTPDQLHCELLKQGGQEIFVWNEEIADGIA